MYVERHNFCQWCTKKYSGSCIGKYRTSLSKPSAVPVSMTVHRIPQHLRSRPTTVNVHLLHKVTNMLQLR